MNKFKSHKTVEQIAKKHRMEVSFIQKQLDIGEPIEHEHTKDHDLAMDIALQHLDEIPDYYTRLKKMEADAKKHHKKFKDVKEQSTSDGDLNYDWNYPINFEKMRYCPKCKKNETREDCRYGTKYWDLFSLPSKLKEEIMHKEKRYCPLCDKREGRSECFYGEKAWDKVSVKDEEYSMARSELKTIDAAVKKLMMTVGKGEGNLEAWVQSKITKAADYIDTAADYVAGGEMEEACWSKFKQVGMKKKGKKMVPDCVPEQTLVDKILVEKTKEMNEGKKKGLRAWFGDSESEDGKPGWVNVVTGGTCASDEPGEGVPKCVSSVKRASMTDAERKSAARRKKSADPEQQSKTDAAKPTYVSTDKTKKKMDEQMLPPIDPTAHRRQQRIEKATRLQQATKGAESGAAGSAVKRLGGSGIYLPLTDEYVIEDGDVKSKNSGKKDACYTKVKSRYSVWPSAYASGALVKCRKVGAANWGNKTNEDVTIEDANGKLYAEVIDLIKPESMISPKSTFMANNELDEATRLQAQTGNIIAVTLSWRAKYYSLKIFFPQVKLPTRREINDELQKVYPGCNVIYHSVSELQPGQPLIQAFGPQGGSYAKLGPNKNYVKTMGEEVELDEEGPSLSVGRGEKLPVSRGGGLTAKGRERYNRETGSNLQAPVTGDVKPGSKAAQRRKNFCSRSQSWKGERGLAARRRWKCN
jgi:hypothetical protein